MENPGHFRVEINTLVYPAQPNLRQRSSPAIFAAMAVLKGPEIKRLTLRKYTIAAPFSYQIDIPRSYFI